MRSRSLREVVERADLDLRRADVVEFVVIVTGGLGNELALDVEAAEERRDSADVVDGVFGGVRGIPLCLFWRSIARCVQ